MKLELVSGYVNVINLLITMKADQMVKTNAVHEVDTLYAVRSAIDSHYLRGTEVVYNRLILSKFRPYCFECLEVADSHGYHRVCVWRL